MSDEMRATVERLERELADLKQKMADEQPAPEVTTTSRRTMLRTVAAGAAGMAVAAVAGAPPVAAADEDPLVLGTPATPNEHET